MSDRGHIYKSFDTELKALKHQLLSMGALVEAHITYATRAIVERDRDLANAVIEGDRLVNQRELAIDEQCIRMLALRQPAASDLRFIAAALKIVVDLERIGDIAVNMAERALSLCDEPPLNAPVDMARMANLSLRMLRDALDAFVDHDVARAESVLSADSEVDQLLVESIETLRGEMKKNPGSVNRALSTIFFAKHLERLADHATNVAEMVVFFVRGQDVRHTRRR